MLLDYCLQRIKSTSIPEFYFLKFIVLMQFYQKKTCLLEVDVHTALVCNMLDIHQNCGPCFNTGNVHRLKFLVSIPSKRKACKFSNLLGMREELTLAATKKGN